MLNKTNTKQGERMSMIGVKKRLEEEKSNILADIKEVSNLSL